MVKRFLWQDRHKRWRVRKGGKTFPLRDEAGVWHEPDTPEGDRLYWEVLTGKRAEAKRSWGAAIDLLMASDRWAALSPRYRADLEPVLDYLREKIGKRDVARLTAADIYAAMDKNTHRVRFANYIPVAISLLFKVVVRKRWLTENPARGIELLKVPKDRRKPHEPWTDAAVKKWRDKATPLPRLIFEIGVGSVQRPADWVDFTWGGLRRRQPPPPAEQDRQAAPPAVHGGAEGGARCGQGRPALFADARPVHRHRGGRTADVIHAHGPDHARRASRSTTSTRSDIAGSRSWPGPAATTTRS